MFVLYLKSEEIIMFQLEGKKIGVVPSTAQDTLFLGNLRKDWSADEFDKMVRKDFQDVASVDLAMPLSGGNIPPGQKRQNRGFAFIQFLSHAAAARAHRVGSKPDFLLGGKWHPVVDWAEEEPEIDSEQMAKIKIAFVGNLPTNADEDYLKKLFEPLGKLEKVVLSKKGRFPVGFIHFAKRSDLDNAIKEMDGKTVEGPDGVAKPVNKNKKRARDESQSKPASKSVSHSKFSREDRARDFSGDQKSKAPRFNNSVEAPDVTDPYEAAVVTLPLAVADRLLQILRLGIATRFDVSDLMIDIQCITSLKKLPESIAVAILDQFMLSGADRYNKGAYLAGLISRHQVDKVGLNRDPLHLSRIGDIASRELELPSLSGRVHLPALDSLASPVGVAASRYDKYTASPVLSRYSASILDNHHTHRMGLGKLGKTSSVSYRTAVSSTSYGNVGMGTHISASDNRQPARPQVRFDPFTGQPYKFDPFTGEPIQLENPPQRSESLY
ncbi:hypothetical protein HHK36_007335 [Tetracentron sinense]|uniref:RRM domain-containing protein n=1 Tax=Tetracentron sinense TaxID=13715 RepID=A0A835DLF5_TETSI|nr:hypothetical protein HHK36_007335 [Tetracentron sinense]